MYKAWDGWRRVCLPRMGGNDLYTYGGIFDDEGCLYYEEDGVEVLGIEVRYIITMVIIQRRVCVDLYNQQHEVTDEKH